MTILIVLTAQSFMKIMFFIRVFETYGFLVQMVGLTILDTVPFMMFFFMFLLFFSLIVTIFQLDIDPGDKYYRDITSTIKAVLYIYRSSVGDIQIPNYQKWTAVLSDPNGRGNSLTYDFILTLIWLFWFLNQFMMLIILLNFLIAIISETYNNVSNDREMYSYKVKANLNAECYSIFNMFVQLPEFKAIALSSEIIIPSDQNDPIQIAASQIKKHVTDLSDQMQNVIKENKQRTDNEFRKMN